MLFVPATFTISQAVTQSSQCSARTMHLVARAPKVQQQQQQQHLLLSLLLHTSDTSDSQRLFRTVSQTLLLLIRPPTEYAYT